LNQLANSKEILRRVLHMYNLSMPVVRHPEVFLWLKAEPA